MALVEPEETPEIDVAAVVARNGELEAVVKAITGNEDVDGMLDAVVSYTRSGEVIVTPTEEMLVVNTDGTPEVVTVIEEGAETPVTNEGANDTAAETTAEVAPPATSPNTNVGPTVLSSTEAPRPKPAVPSFVAAGRAQSAPPPDIENMPREEFNELLAKAAGV